VLTPRNTELTFILKRTYLEVLVRADKLNSKPKGTVTIKKRPTTTTLKPN